jgi:hypothetical protein
MALLIAAQDEGDARMAVLGVVLIALGVLWPIAVRSFEKFAEVPQTGGWGPTSSEDYERRAAVNTERVRRRAATARRSAKFVCVGSILLGIPLVAVGFAAGH